MIISTEEVIIHHVNTNVGHRIIVRYDKLNFVKCIDMKNVHESKHQALQELDALAFDEFRCGRFTFDKQEKHDKAVSIIQLKDEELIDRIYSKNPFEKEIIKRELKARGLYDQDIYYMGFYGIDVAKQYAIEMLKGKIVYLQSDEQARQFEKNCPEVYDKKSSKTYMTTLLSDLKRFTKKLTFVKCILLALLLFVFFQSFIQKKYTPSHEYEDVITFLPQRKRRPILSLSVLFAFGQYKKEAPMFVLYDDGLIIFKASELYELTGDFGAWDYSRDHNKFYHTYITQKEIEKLLGELKAHRLFYLKDDYASYNEKTDPSWTILYFWNKKDIKRIFVEDYIHNNYLPQVIHIIHRKLNNLNWLTKKDIQIWEPIHLKIVFTPYRSASLKEVVMCPKEWNVYKYRSGHVSYLNMVLMEEFQNLRKTSGVFQINGKYFVTHTRPALPEEDLILHKR